VLSKGPVTWLMDKGGLEGEGTCSLAFMLESPLGTGLVWVGEGRDSSGHSRKQKC
jgi:hypothetical protein